MDKTHYQQQLRLLDRLFLRPMFIIIGAIIAIVAMVAGIFSMCATFAARDAPPPSKLRNG
jgi:hypothetical protein